MSNKSSSSSSTSMASVWDTLNRMKARQKAAEQSAKTHRRSDQTRKDAFALFERQISEAVQRGEMHGPHVMAQMYPVLEGDENVQAVVAAYAQRLKCQKDMREELCSVNTLVVDTREVLGVAALAVRGANNTSRNFK